MLLRLDGTRCKTYQGVKFTREWFVETLQITASAYLHTLKM